MELTITTHDQTPSLWADVKALERFPYAAATRSFRDPQARQRFVARTQKNEGPCPFGALREVV